MCMLVLASDGAGHGEWGGGVSLNRDISAIIDRSSHHKNQHMSGNLTDGHTVTV